MVLVSSAYYAKIDKAHRAVFSKIVMQEMLRDDLHFSGVVVSDDLSAQAVRDFSPGKRAVSFLSSGGDLIIVGDAGEVPAMVTAIKERAKSDPDFRAELAVKAARCCR